MSVFTVFPIPGALPVRARGSLRTTLADVVRRLAAAPLDSPALVALAAQAPVRPCTRMRARRRTVPGPGA